MSGFTNNMNEENMFWNSQSKDRERSPHYHGDFGDYNIGEQQLGKLRSTG